ncbi:MAG: hypothetical protein M0Z27_05605, partial [Thermaerobacter sp.]|nr:hypothetical protein [Thermaerobacter sp.]
MRLRWGAGRGLYLLSALLLVAGCSASPPSSGSSFSRVPSPAASGSTVASRVYAEVYAPIPGLAVSVGYADTLRASNPPNFPNPWYNSPGVNFIGAGGPWDAGGILLRNTTAAPITVANVTVTLPGPRGDITPGTSATSSLWGSFTIPAGQAAILTETAGGTGSA